MSGPLVEELTMEELWAELANTTASLFATTAKLQVYPTRQKVSVHFGEGSLDHAERLAMLLDEYERRNAAIGGGAS